VDSSRARKYQLQLPWLHQFPSLSEKYSLLMSKCLSYPAMHTLAVWMSPTSSMTASSRQISLAAANRDVFVPTGQADARMTKEACACNLTISFLLWILGLVWVYNPIFSFDAFLHESGHALFALATGSKIVEFDLILPSPHITIEPSSSFAEHLTLFGGFLVTFLSYLLVLSYLYVRKNQLYNLMVFPLFLTFPNSWGDFGRLGLHVSLDVLGLACVLGSFVSFFLRNRRYLHALSRTRLHGSMRIGCWLGYGFT